MKLQVLPVPTNYLEFLLFKLNFPWIQIRIQEVKNECGPGSTALMKEDEILFAKILFTICMGSVDSTRLNNLLQNYYS